MDLTQATRPIMWNIQAAWAMYALFGVALAVFAAGTYRHVAVWRQGKADEERLGDWGRRLAILVKELLFQERVRDSALPGWFHSLIFYSFGVLVVTTSVVALDYDFGTSVFKGWVYVLLTLGCDVGGALILAGAVIAGLRRYITKPKTIETTLGDSWALLLIVLLVVSGFAVEALRIAVLGDRWAYLSLIGWALSRVFAGLSREAAGAVHVWLWWLHAGLAMAWIASIPFTKFFHLLALPTNVFFSRQIAKGQAAAIQARTFRTLLVSCPHCFNVLANEYPQFGARLNVVHHSQFLHGLVSNGVIRPSTPGNQRVVYHDPCYLGRYQGIYESPRKLLEAIPGTALTEMANCKQRSFCCGGGGGHFWMDLRTEGAQRVNNLRVDQAREVGAAVIATGCPYCHQMLDDSVKLRDVEAQVKVLDIATLLRDSVEGRRPAGSQSGGLRQ